MRENEERKTYCGKAGDQDAGEEQRPHSNIVALSAKIDKGMSISASLKKFVKEMELEFAMLRKQQAETDEICQEMYVDYIQIEPDLEASLTGVREVLGTLR
eukprot:16112332-Heterocapsa_arctica.AAC.1